MPCVFISNVLIDLNMNMFLNSSRDGFSHTVDINRKQKTWIFIFLMEIKGNKAIVFWCFGLFQFDTLLRVSYLKGNMMLPNLLKFWHEYQVLNLTSATSECSFASC